MSQTKKTSKNSVKNRSNKMSFSDFMKRGFRNLGKEYKVWLDGDEQAAASPAPTNRMRSRMYSFVMVVIFIFIVWIVYNLIKTAVIESKDYQLLAENQQLQSISVMANRGSIYDINGHWLYVKLKDMNGRVVFGWLEPDMQCGSPFTTCP